MISSSIRHYLRTSLPWPVFKRLKRCYEESMVFFSSKDLTSLARIYRTDKWGRHFYTPIYSFWFRDLRYKPLRILEIGVGGVENPKNGGSSLRMWKRYFPNAIITGIDIYDKTGLQENRIHIYKGDQSDPDFLLHVSEKEGPFDIIVDDGSHMQSHVIKSYETLFPVLVDGGIYVIEDTQTSYWPGFEGSTIEMDTVQSAMNYFIRRIHQVNRSEWIKGDMQKDYKDENIDSISFYHNLIFITKK